jgi:hypothetical protein
MAEGCGQTICAKWFVLFSDVRAVCFVRAIVFKQGGFFWTYCNNSSVLRILFPVVRINACRMHKDSIYFVLGIPKLVISIVRATVLDVPNEIA